MSKNLRKQLPKALLKKLYINEKRSLEDIARLYGVSRVAVWKYCRTAGISRRNRSEARLEAEKRGKVPQAYYEVNEEFFYQWSKDMAYILGLIATDGCISKTGTVSLRINDKVLLGKVRRAMDSTHDISASKQQKGLYLLYITRKKITDDLDYLGIFPNKSKDIKFPYVPDEFLPDFIRGVFDGDGSVFFEARNMIKSTRSSFVSSSEDFIIILEQKLRKMGLPRRKIYKRKTKNTFSYSIKYSHDASIKLAEILYKDVDKDGLYLARKYNRFQHGTYVGGKYESSD